MKEVERLARFISEARFEDLEPSTLQALKIRLLDALGCAFGALKAEPINYLKQTLMEFGGSPLVSLIGNDKTAPDRAAFYNGALIRYLDFNDSFLAKKETCHPSDTISSIIAAAEYKNLSGKEFLLALSIAYGIQCRLTEVAPVRDRGFDHTVQASYAIGGGVAKALGLPERQIAHAIALAAVPSNALRVTRTGTLSHWKGLAAPFVAFAATQAAFLARSGITGPLEVFEGNKGFKESISGPFEMTWKKEDLALVEKTILKKYNAEVHAQSVLEGVIALRQEVAIPNVERIEVSLFDVAYNIIGGGVEGSKMHVTTKEEADHSLPYLIAVAMLDGEVSPEQFNPERIKGDDVQTLLRKVKIIPNSAMSARFPEEMPCRITLFLKEGKSCSIEKKDYEGFITRPFSFEDAVKKCHKLTDKMTDPLIEIIATLEKREIKELTSLL